MFGKQEILEVIDRLKKAQPTFDSAFNILRGVQSQIVNYGTGTTHGILRLNS